MVSLGPGHGATNGMDVVVGNAHAQMDVGTQPIRRSNAQ
jgi:hypothetical protein